MCNLCGSDEVCNLSMDGSVTCQIEECGAPVMPEYVMSFGNLYNVGANVCYACLDGYVNKGGLKTCSVCSGTGMWTPVDIECSAPTTTTTTTTTTTVKPELPSKCDSDSDSESGCE